MFLRLPLTHASRQVLDKHAELFRCPKIAISGALVTFQSVVKADPIEPRTLSACELIRSLPR
jgi:hypothetical protein